MSAHWMLRYYWGFLLPSICDAWEWSREACEPLHEALKSAFDIDSTSYLDEDDFINYIDSIHGLLVTEFGTMVPHVNEPPGVAEMTMRDFLNYIYYDYQAGTVYKDGDLHLSRSARSGT